MTPSLKPVQTPILAPVLTRGVSKIPQGGPQRRRTFIRTCIKDKWVIAGFDWHGWAENNGAAFCNDMSLLMEAEALDLAKVLTVIFGREHANHGYLVEAYRNGLLLTVLKRAQQLSALEPLQEAA